MSGIAENIDLEKIGNGYDPFDEMMSNNNIIPPDNEEEDGGEEEKNNTPPPAKKNTSKEDNIKALRDKKDKLEKELNDAKEKISSFEELTSLKEIRDYIKAKTGKDKVTQEEVTAYINKNKQRKERLGSLEKSLQEKEAKIKDLSLESSEEWQNVYLKNIKEAQEGLAVTISNYDAEGKVRAPELTNNLYKKLLSLNEDGTVKNPQQIKAIVSVFKKEYYDATGMDYDAPSITELTKAVESPFAAYKKATEARKNWDSTKEQMRKERIFQQSEEQKRNIQVEKTNRDLIVNDYLITDEANNLRTEFGEEFDKFVQEEHSFMNTVLENPKEGQRGYNNFIASMAKAKLVDSALVKIKSLKDQVDKLKKQIEKGRPPKGSSVEHLTNNDKEESFDISKISNGYDPSKELG